MPKVKKKKKENNMKLIFKKLKREGMWHFDMFSFCSKEANEGKRLSQIWHKSQ